MADLLYRIYLLSIPAAVEKDIPTGTNPIDIILGDLLDEENLQSARVASNMARTSSGFSPKRRTIPQATQTNTCLPQFVQTGLKETFAERFDRIWRAVRWTVLSTTDSNYTRVWKDFDNLADAKPLEDTVKPKWMQQRLITDDENDSDPESSIPGITPLSSKRFYGKWTNYADSEGAISTVVDLPDPR